MSGSTVRLTMYSKPDCHLCDEMAEVIDSVRAERPDLDLALEKVDITTDRELKRRYGREIPVLMIDGRETFKARATKEELMRALVPPAAGPSRENGSPPRAIAALLLAATIGGFAWFAGRGIQNAEAGTRVLAGKLLKIEDRDTPPIAFDLMTIDGKRVSLSDYKDKVVFVNFWATWCPPCIEEMPSLRKLQEKLAGHDDFVMLLISADESWDPVKRFFPEDKPPFTVLLDQSGALAKQYGTTIFPETYLLASGRIRAFIEGPRDWDAWYAETFLRSFLRNSG